MPDANVRNCCGVSVRPALLLLCVACSFQPLAGVAQGIETYAGGDTGDDGAAMSAQLHGPADLAFDTSGNLFIADARDARIRKISVDGTIHTVAGYGRTSLGEQTCNGQLDSPRAIAVNAAGGVLIADLDGQCIEEVMPAGNVLVVAGTGYGGFSVDGTQATLAQIGSPAGVAFDSSGTIIFSDSLNNRVRKIDSNGNLVTLAGDGSQFGNGDGIAATSASLNHPTAIAYDAVGNLFIADSYAHTIRKVDTTGIIATVAGNGLRGYEGDGNAATSARLNYPNGIKIDISGNIYIADTGNSVVRRVDTNGKITTVAGNGIFAFSGDGGSAKTASLLEPVGVALDTTGNLFIADDATTRIRKVTSNGYIASVAGNAAYADGTYKLDASFYRPGGIAIDPNGNIFLADTLNHRVRKITVDGTLLTTAGTGVPAYSGDGTLAIAAGLANPTAVAVDGVGNIYIADLLSIRKVDATGKIKMIAGSTSNIRGCSPSPSPALGSQIGTIQSLAVDSIGNVYAADPYCGVVHKVDPNGVLSNAAGNAGYGYSGDGGPATSATLFFPQAVAVDQFDNLYIADSSNDRVRKVDALGIITTVAGIGNEGYSGDGGPAIAAQLCVPNGIAVDAEGNLFISDSSNSVIRQVDLHGTISTIAGTPGFSYLFGNPGPGSLAFLGAVSGIGVHGGVVYFADYFNQRIQQVRLNDIFADGFE